MIKPPLTASDVPPEWIALVRDIIVREGRAVRGPADRPVIEVKGLRDNSWRSLKLYSSAHAFATTADRDAVLKQLVG